MQSFVPQPLRLQVVGLNHRTASLAVREKLASSGDLLRQTLEAFRQRYPDAEGVLLSTCNRVELYIARPLRSEPSVETAVHFLADLHGVNPADLLPHLYHFEDRLMVEHLYAVASSLDSLVIGETQILSQVKQAYQAAVELHTAGKPGGAFHTLFQRALAAAKEVHDSTSLSSGRVSVASVAVDLARGVFDSFSDKTVLCIGAGKMATLMLRHLQELAPKKLIVTNRSLDKAAVLASEFGGQSAPLDRLDDLLIGADIVLTSTGAEHALITSERFRPLLKPRRYRPIVMVDIAVPRDIEPAVGKLSNVYLYNVDDLQQVVTETHGRRDTAVEQSQQLLRRHVDEFVQWFGARDVGPIVKALYEHSHDIARRELDELIARSPELTEDQKKELERTMHRVIGKILHSPVTQLTQQAEASARPMLAAAIMKLFELKPEEQRTGDSGKGTEPKDAD